MITDQAILSHLRVVIQNEVAAGYPLLARVPSSHTWKVRDYVSGLADSERAALLEAFAMDGLFSLRPSRDSSRSAYGSGNPAYRRFVEALPQLGDWKYADVRLLRSVLADVRSNDPSPEFAAVPSEVLQRAETIRPTSSTEIRRAMKRVMTEEFNAGPVKRGGGEWLYQGSHDGRSFQLRVDYGGRTDQLRYGMSFADASRGIRAFRLSYERLVGFGQGQWDLVTADNLEESVDILVELIKQVLALLCGISPEVA